MHKSFSLDGEEPWQLAVNQVVEARFDVLSDERCQLQGSDEEQAILERVD